MRLYSVMGTVLILAACQADQVETTSDFTPTTPALSEADVELTPTRVALFGDLHIHTKNSFDAYIFGTRATPDDAYAFARGETIDNGVGVPIKLSGPPLDFLAVTDHGEYLGIIEQMATRGSALSKTDTAKSVFGVLATDRRTNFLRIGQTVVTGEPIDDIYDVDHITNVWGEIIDSADRNYRPGEMTTFAGYEFTSMVQVTETGAANLHRNVIFKDAAPERLFSTLNSPNPEDLWDWMDDQRNAGMDVMSIPHNSNASNGMMFSSVSYDGNPFPAGYAAQRLRNEPVVELTQVKGTSETHPALSPNDEWAGFEQYENLIGSNDRSNPVSGSFVREAIARSLSMPGNPYQVGVIGSSDTHVAAGAFSEQHFFGKFPHDMDNATRQSVPKDREGGWEVETRGPEDLISTPQYGASGLAGVWSEANTRPAIFEAMRRRETFATSGPRIRVRLFAGDFTDEDLRAPDFLDRAYATGVPMGAGISEASNFAVLAYADPDGEPLERLQMIALRENGSEQVYDIACAGNAQINPETHRCDLPAGEVDLITCQAKGTGAGSLQTVWADPDAQSGAAAYYVRVLERPKCRWSSWDAARAGTRPNPWRPDIVQDRAWSSAIWVTNGNISPQ